MVLASASHHTEAAPCNIYVEGAGAGAALDLGVGIPGAASLPSLSAAHHAVRASLSVRGNQLSSDFVICLGPGTHSVPGSSPISFNKIDSVKGTTTARVVWRGLGTQTNPSIVTGGVKVCTCPGNLVLCLIFTACTPTPVSLIRSSKGYTHVVNNCCLRCPVGKPPHLAVAMPSLPRFLPLQPTSKRSASCGCKRLGPIAQSYNRPVNVCWPRRYHRHACVYVD